MAALNISPRITGLEESIRKISEAAAKIPGCVRFDIGQPDFRAPDHIREAAITAIRGKPLGYAPMAGIPELRAAVAEYENKKGLDFKAENIMVTNGGTGALFCAMLALVERGDEVILPNPSWSPYELMVKSIGGVPKYAKFFGGGGSPKASSERSERDDFDWKKLDAESIKNAITPKTKVLLVNSPDNPTGRVISKDDLKSIASIAADAGVAIISDEVYDKLLFGGAKHCSIAQFAPENTMIINSVSKTYAMTGWRLGWLAAPANAVRELAKCNRATIACANSVSQYAALAAISGDQKCVEEMRKEYEIRRDTIMKRMDAIGWTYIIPEGAFYAFPQVGKKSWDFSLDLLEKAKVATVPGASFGPSGENHVRLCFGSVNSDGINEGFDRIEKYLKDNK